MIKEPASVLWVKASEGCGACFFPSSQERARLPTFPALSSTCCFFTWCHFCSQCTQGLFRKGRDCCLCGGMGRPAATGLVCPKVSALPRERWEAQIIPICDFILLCYKLIASLYHNMFQLLVFICFCVSSVTLVHG